MLLLAGIERTLNALLARDPAAPARLARLAGNRIVLRFEQPRFELLMAFHAQGVDLIRLEGGDDTTADAVVELDAETLGELLGGASMERLMFQGRLAVRGQVHQLEAVRELVLDLDLDWEAELAHWLGDMPAHGLAEGLRGLAHWGARTRRELSADIAEYVFEEARLLPGRHQLDNLRDHLTELEVATDRVAARLDRLRRRLDEGDGS
ncbi:ubiquinone biosynthesis accessory factor UbiJ [Billgrantia gudaonensis]|uniref:Ubiquinone biosynthesis accessory factor UbiJ n=1 Tax=Billgrantia gudaonensis TaxID=376427 RepID=A0A1G8RLJ5_9GAMM|nr:SCP2 sterol-binding domain-containing protein [Halomonas gudaonensis]SDJ17954.1 ubiquinone biosynthesis protein UbiJ [Halomonas gudaonensis]